MRTISVKDFMDGEFGCLTGRLKNVDRLRGIVESVKSVVKNLDVSNSVISDINRNGIISVTFEFDELFSSDIVNIRNLSEFMNGAYSVSIGGSMIKEKGVDLSVNMKGFLR